MMQKFALYAQIPVSRQKQVLNILSGVTAQQPVDIHEQHLIYRQTKLANTVSSKKGATKQTTPKQELTYHRLSRDINLSDSWILHIEQVPESGVKDVISQRISQQPLTSEDLARFHEGSEWYSFATQYTCRGSRFVQNQTVVIRMTRTFVLLHASEADPLNGLSPVEDTLQLLDRSGTFLIEAYTVVDDVSNAALRERAIRELQQFTQTLEGVLEFRVPGRLALDTTVK